MLQLRIWLFHSKPEIWRRVLVDPRLTLEQLHTVIQTAIGWQNCHMHQFHEKDRTCYRIPSRFDDDMGGLPAIDERKVQLKSIFAAPGKTIAYEYDFGDGWVHQVRFEEVVDSETYDYDRRTFIEKGRGVFTKTIRAAICVAGERSGPPEDCGGIPGLEHILDLLQTPPKSDDRSDDAQEAREILQWVGDWDPAFIDLATVNQNLGRVRVKKSLRDT